MKRTLLVQFGVVTPASAVVLQRLAPGWELACSLAAAASLGALAVLLALVQRQLRGGRP